MAARTSVKLGENLRWAPHYLGSLLVGDPIRPESRFTHEPWQWLIRYKKRRYKKRGSKGHFAPPEIELANKQANQFSYFVGASGGSASVSHRIVVAAPAPAVLPVVPIRD